MPIDVIPELEAEDDLSELEDDAPELDSQESKLNPSWINDNPDTSLKDLGLTDYDKLKDFMVEHGGQLKCLNLKGSVIDNDQFEQIIQSCPNLTHIFIKSPIEDNALEHLRGIPLTSVDFDTCGKLRTTPSSILKICLSQALISARAGSLPTRPSSILKICR